jgi:hypothetical protein
MDDNEAVKVTVETVVNKPDSPVLVMLKFRLRGDNKWMEFSRFVPVGGTVTFLDGCPKSDPQIIETPRVKNGLE